MKIDYYLNARNIPLVYGETFVSLVKKADFHACRIILITNQRYYDLFSEKINHALGTHQTINWYICRNDVHCNTMSELEGIFSFLEELPKGQSLQLVGFGNEGVIQLTSFLRKTSVYPTASWLVPLSIQAFSQALLPFAAIEWQNKTVMSVTAEVQQIIYDFTLTNKKGAGKLVDFMVFLRCGIVCSHDFLQQLFKNYPDQKRLQQTSFNGMLDKLLQFYEIAGPQINQFGQPFEQAFLRTENGHLLSGSMKCFLGMLLHLLWCQETASFEFNFKNFLTWLAHLGFPVDFPKEIFLSDYTENMMQQLKEGASLIFLSDIGQQQKNTVQPTPVQLLTTIENYQKIVAEIRG